MKTFFIAVLMGLAGIAHAEQPVAEWPPTVDTVKLSTSAPVLVSASALSYSTATMTAHYFSVSLFNVESSTAVYTFADSATVAPTLTCTTGAPIGTGTTSAPYHAREDFIRGYMWALACGSGDITLRRIRRAK